MARETSCREEKCNYCIGSNTPINPIDTTPCFYKHGDLLHPKQMTNKACIASEPPSRTQKDNKQNPPLENVEISPFPNGFL